MTAPGGGHALPSIACIPRGVCVLSFIPTGGLNSAGAPHGEGVGLDPADVPSMCNQPSLSPLSCTNVGMRVIIITVRRLSEPVAVCGFCRP